MEEIERLRAEIEEKRNNLGLVDFDNWEKVAESIAEDNAYFSEFTHESECDDIIESYKKVFKIGMEYQRLQMIRKSIPFYEILKVVPPTSDRDNVRVIVLPSDNN